ncbi:MAG: cytidine deaminase [Planctomycetota bacterium]
MIKQNDLQRLVRQSAMVRRHAYAPYSKFRVGAAVQAESGQIYCGTNVENVCFPAGTCAERSAVSAAVAAGEIHIVAVAVASAGGVTPCGVCRQVLLEFGTGMTVLCVDTDKIRIDALLDESQSPDLYHAVVGQYCLTDLLPSAFDDFEGEGIAPGR